MGYDGEAAEIDQTNNTVQGQTFQYAHRRVTSSLLAVPTAAKRGQRLTLPVGLENVGPAAVREMGLYVWLLPQDSRDPATNLASRRVRINLNPGATSQVAVPFVVPKDAAPGSRTLSLSVYSPGKSTVFGGQFTIDLEIL